MDAYVTDPQEWAAAQFGNCDLKDRRRTRRLVKFAAQVAAHPSGSIPQQTEGWADCKAAYRLFDQQDVTFEAVCQPHWDLRRQCGAGTFLIASDTTELDFGKHRRLSGVGPTGNGSGKGFLLHSALLVSAHDESLLGVAGGVLVRRQRAPAKETSAQRRKRPRESERWGQLIDQVGRPPQGATWIHVMDREADNFEVFCHCQAQGTGWVVRTRNFQRCVWRDAAGQESLPLKQWLAALPVAGQTTLDVPRKAKTRREPARSARTATLEVRYGRLWLPPPRQKTPYVRQRGSAPIAMRVVWVRERHPPAGEEPIEWVLYCSEEVQTLAQALVQVAYYRRRWLIEEWHKALKTGTQVTARQFETGDRLAPLIGLLSVEAVRLVQLKTVARQQPERPAEELVPPRYVAILQRSLKGGKPLVTVRDFFRGLARLGGFLARKSDGEPGWQTLWRGWETFVLILRGSELPPVRSD